MAVNAAQLIAAPIVAAAQTKVNAYFVIVDIQRLANGFSTVFERLQLTLRQLMYYELVFVLYCKHIVLHSYRANTSSLYCVILLLCGLCCTVSDRRDDDRTGSSSSRRKQREHYDNDDDRYANSNSRSGNSSRRGNTSPFSTDSADSSHDGDSRR
jgi:hypothetical protein